jgi:hypothetical protein
MLAYNTNTAAPPISQALLQNAQRDLASGLLSQPDLAAGVGQAAAVDMSRYAQQAQNDLANREQQAQRQLALAGLQQMQGAQQQDRDLQSRRIQLLMGLYQ